MAKPSNRGSVAKVTRTTARHRAGYAAVSRPVLQWPLIKPGHGGLHSSPVPGDPQARLAGQMAKPRGQCRSVHTVNPPPPLSPRLGLLAPVNTRLSSLFATTLSRSLTPAFRGRWLPAAD